MNSLATIENSGTYQMLINMGFPLQQSKSAAKIYLNDIEAAVVYCSDHISDVSLSIDTIFHYDEGKQGANFKKCCDLLQISYQNFLSLFVSWFSEEEFEDDQLLDEFIDNTDYSESFFIQYIQDIAQENEIIAFNDELAMRLFSDLSDAIISHMPHFKNTRESISIGYAHIFEPILIIGYIREIRHFLQAKHKYKYKIFTEIPDGLCVLCHAYYPKFEHNIINIDMDLCHNSNLISYATSLYTTQCKTLFPSQTKDCMHSVASLHIIGKNNNVPLLTYLIDAYNRYRIELSTQTRLRVKKRFKHKPRSLYKYESTHKFIVISIKSFINKICVACNECPPSFKNICIKSMEYLTSFAGFSQATAKCQSIYRIDDSLLGFANNIFETYSFVDKYINNTDYTSLPCQFDLVIIPSNVCDHDNDENVRFDCNIRQILTNGNVAFVWTKFGMSPNINQMETMVNKLIGNKKNQRCCMLIDRRNNEMFVYQTGHKNDTINVAQFVNESLFDNSMNCLIPGLCGCMDSLNGYLFSLSFHIISRYEVRVYLNLDGFISRFFISDLNLYLPQFFKENNVNYESAEFKSKFQKTKQILSDSKFDEFYKLILMDDSESPYS